MSSRTIGEVNILTVLSMCIFKMFKYPCGHCYECLSKIRNDWSIRLQAEWRNSSSAYHAILTYDEEHLPKTKNGLATVRKSDFIKFMKRLRHKFNSHLKFFAVSEYGTTTQRPHYHVLLFNVPLFEDIERFESYNISEQMRSLVSSAWKNGEVRKRSSYVQNEAQIHYILKDIYNWLEPLDLFNVYCKLSKDKSKARELRNFMRNTYNPFLLANKEDDREKNFRLMSKNLGISLLDEIQMPKEVLNYDYFMSWNSTYIQSKYSFKQKSEFLEKQRKFYATLTYDDKGRFVLPSDVAGIRDFYECAQYHKDKASGRTVSKTVRYALPKYVRSKLISRGLRELLNHNSTIDRYLALQTYLEQFGDYDSTHPVPMYLEEAKRDWRVHASRHKDLLTSKFFKNEYL